MVAWTYTAALTRCESGGPKIPPGADCPGVGAPPGPFPPPLTADAAAVGRGEEDVDEVGEADADVELPEAEPVAAADELPLADADWEDADWTMVIGTALETDVA
jgi:hypothetical protein